MILVSIFIGANLQSISDTSKSFEIFLGQRDRWLQSTNVMLFHIHLLSELIAVHIDVDDVLALAETGTVEGELACAGVTGLIGTAVDISQAVGYEGCHPDIVVGVVVDCHHVAAVRL
jgi:hypothetical protein